MFLVLTASKFSNLWPHNIVNFSKVELDSAVAQFSVKGNRVAQYNYKKNFRGNCFFIQFGKHQDFICYYANFDRLPFALYCE